MEGVAVERRKIRLRMSLSNLMEFKKEHNFEIEPFLLTAQQIKDATKHFVVTGQREVRILCKQDTRESRPLENKIKNNSGYSDQLTEIIKNFKEGKYNV